jgi:hypothetical protein
MKTIRRYRCHGDMTDDDGGAWTGVDDHEAVVAAMQARIGKLTEAIREHFMRAVDDGLWSQNDSDLLDAPADE